MSDKTRREITINVSITSADEMLTAEDCKEAVVERLYLKQMAEVEGDEVSWDISITDQEVGAKPAPLDFAGQSLAVGDTVAYTASSGRSKALLKGQITEFSKSGLMLVVGHCHKRSSNVVKVPCF